MHIFQTLWKLYTNSQSIIHNAGSLQMYILVRLDDSLLKLYSTKGIFYKFLRIFIKEKKTFLFAHSSLQVI